MSTITADRTLLLVLSQMRDVTEIRDADGNLVGVYTPKRKDDEDIHKLFNLEKARKTLAREGGQGRPLKEIMRRLKAKGKKG